MSQKFEYFGKYILLEKLAAGGMAEVWLARAPGAGGIGKFVAIKKILAQYSDNQEFIQMFRDEAAIAMHLSHSNIVSIYEFGQEKHQLFLVLDYVEGRNLRQILNKMKGTHQRFSIDQICYIAKEVAAGLDHAHRCLNSATGKPLNITHRDMSPQNVMVSFEGEVKIIDFGIAKAENQMENTKTGTLKGKFGYMSPEQADGQPTDLRTDIFSLGIALWELLANDRLFIANNEINTLRKIRECQVPSLTKINPNIDPELERIVMKALTRDRNLRYQTAAALHRDLNRFLNRHYPDFTPHDFAVFIKTIYADEILETRKRLIEYSKIPFKNQIGKQEFSGDEDKTIVTSFEQKSEVQPTGDNTADGWLMQGGTATSTPFPNSNSGKEDITITATETFSSGKKESGNGSVSRPAQVNEQPPLLDITALKNKLSQKIEVKPEMPYNPDTDVELDDALNEDSSPDRRRPQALRKKAKSSSALRFAVSIGVGVLIYGLGLMHFPNQVAVLERETQRIFRTILAGAEGPSEDLGSQSQPAPIRNAPETVAEAPVIQNVTKPLIIQSVPSGAEIFIDGVSTKESTPSRIQVPADRKVVLTLKKERYLDYVKSDFEITAFPKSSLTATLQKAMVAYLDIDVVPSRNVKVYVNGQLLKENTLPIYKYAVPAGTAITIGAVNAVTGEKVQEKITLLEDQRRSITLKLNKNRQPSSFGP